MKYQQIRCLILGFFTHETRILRVTVEESQGIPEATAEQQRQILKVMDMSEWDTCKGIWMIYPPSNRTEHGTHHEHPKPVKYQGQIYCIPVIVFLINNI